MPSRHGDQREEGVELLRLSESVIDVLVDALPETHSIAELLVGDLELPVVIRECSWRADGTVRARLAVDPRVREGDATELRRQIVRLKRAARPKESLGRP
jgi:hypothetical protein